MFQQLTVSMAASQEARVRQLLVLLERAQAPTAHDEAVWAAVVGAMESTFAVQCVGAIARAYHVHVSAAVLLRQKEEPSLSAMVGALKGEEAVMVDWEAETRLDPAISPHTPFLPHTANPMDGLTNGPALPLLTGATGHVGSALLESILLCRKPPHSTVVRCVCLVRAGSTELGLQRLVGVLESKGYQEAAVLAAAGAVEVLIGDLSEESLPNPKLNPNPDPNPNPCDWGPFGGEPWAGC